MSVRAPMRRLTSTQVYMAKLGFIVVFENVVFGLKALVQYMIPDVPSGLCPPTH